jgi:hypothetical protein
MNLTDKQKLAVLMSFHMLWGSVLWFSISKYGLGISTDSVHFLFGGANFSAGRGLFSFDGSFLSGWPPLYPVLLGVIHRLSGLSTFISANILQAAAFTGAALCLSILFLRIFPGNFLLAFAANLLSDTGAVVLTSFDVVGSDYVHLALVLLLLWLTGSYLENKSPRYFLALCAVGMLAMLQRYLGLAAIATGAIAVLFFSEGALIQRITRSMLIALSAVPAGVWLLITSQSTARRAPVSFAENFYWFSQAILQWFMPEEVANNHPILYAVGLWISIAGLITFLVLSASRYKLFTSFTIPVLLYGSLYMLALFGSASITYFNRLDGRFLLPLYIPFVTLFTLGVEAALRLAQEKTHQAGFPYRPVSASAVLLLVIAPTLLLQVSLPIVTESHVHGAAGGDNVFNTSMWHENTALNYLLSHPPRGKYLLISNYPDGIAFYTGHACIDSPRQYSGPYGTEEFPVNRYASELFSSGEKVYLIWIEPNEHSYFYDVEELNAIAQIEPRFVNEDGGVYRLKQRERGLENREGITDPGIDPGTR